MEIVCKSCGRHIVIPDERIPKGTSFSITCPQCSTKISVSAAPETKSQDMDVATACDSKDTDLYIDEDQLNFIEEGRKIALICGSGEITSAKQILEDELEYKVVLSKSPKEAVNRIRFTIFDLIVLSEDFSNVSAIEDNIVLNYIIPLPMSSRRRMFVVLVGDNLRTLDNMGAFVKSVNLLVNRRDIPNLRNIIKKATLDNDRFYKIFKDALRSIKGIEL